MGRTGLRRACRHADGGAAAVEAALLLPLLVLVVFGSLDFGRALWWKIQVTNAAREGAAWARLHPCDDAGIKSRIDAELGAVPSSYDVARTPVGTCSTSTTGVKVTVSEVVPFLTPGLTLVAGQTGVTVAGYQDVTVLASAP